ncbi:TIGR03936 family radical SAM-associated protein [Collinsella stercoris]|uniref:TIGR03936 family radical SAM-associated protein n=1 Tax=Collinsella stercoris TaxID=147206 RepID=UPI003AEF8DB7
MTNVTEPTLFRLRVAYPKLGRLKYLGHLELIHTVEQIVRRAKLPYAVTQGFSPHMRIAYTSALPVGTSSTAEYFDVYLTELVPAEQALCQLQAAAPVDMRPLAAGYVELRRPALTAEIDEVHYLLELIVAPGASVAEGELAQVLSGWLEHGAVIPYRRGKKSKSLDIAHVLKGARHAVAPDGNIWLELATRCDNDGSLRPEILIAALDQALRGLDPGVGEEIVSTGIQRLTVFSSYLVERCSQRIACDGDGVSYPLGRELCVPSGSLAARVRVDALSNL